MEKFKRAFFIFLRIIVSILLLVFLFKQVDTKSLIENLRSADLRILFLAFFIYFFVYLLCLLRWEMLLKAVKIHLPLKRVIISFAGGHFFSLFLPSTIGGDLMRSLDLSMHTKRPKEVIATVLLDRLSGYIGLVLLALIAVIFGWRLIDDKTVLFSVLILLLVLVVALLILFNNFFYSKINKLLHSPNAGKIRELIKNLHQEMYYFRHHKKIIINNLILSVIIQTIPSVTAFMIALSLGFKINIIYFFVFLPIISAITLLPISLGGLGLRDATTIYLFTRIGVSKDLAFAMSLLNFSFILIYGAIGGLIYVLTVHHRRIQHHKPSVIHSHT